MVPGDALTSLARSLTERSNDVGTVRIPLQNDKTQFAIVDEEDAPLVLPHVWKAYQSHRTTYARSSIDGEQVCMHQLLLVVQPGNTPDHRDHNGLNNVRSNLREATGEQNQWNRKKSRTIASRYKGVTYKQFEQRWVAQMTHEGKKIHIGRFKTEKEAARAYDTKAIELRGEWARQTLNFPGDAPLDSPEAA